MPRKALDFYMVAAHLTPKDLSLWHRLATLSTELGFVRQAIYCLGKARLPRDGRRLPGQHAGQLLGDRMSAANAGTGWPLEHSAMPTAGCLAVASTLSMYPPVTCVQNIEQ